MEGLGRVAIVSAALCLIATPSGLAQKTGPDPIYLGVDVPAESLYGGLRIVFRYQGGRWEPMPENPNSLDKEGDYYPNMGAGYPRQVSWTVAFDGKKIGTVNSTQPVHFTERGELGKQILAPNSVLPRIPDRANKFNFGGRPLVLVSRPNYADPDVWKPFRPTDAAVIKQVRAAYLHQYGPTAGCGSRCSAQSILVEEGYRSAHGEMLIVVRPASEHHDEPGLERLVCDCETAAWDPHRHWYLVQRGAVKFVGYSLTLIDAGDYDGDGVSEMLFWDEGEGDSKDGYVLLCPRDASIHRFEIPGDPH